MRYLQTNKLFYNKWPFKILCYLKGASRVKYSGCETVIDYCLGKYVPKYPWWEAKEINKTLLIEFSQTVQQYLDKEIQIRCEGPRFSIFCKDLDLYNSLVRDFSKWIIEVYEPEDLVSYDYLLNFNKNHIICESYPWSLYEYKVVIRESMQQHERLNFVEWLSRYDNKVRIAGESLKFMLGQRRWMQDPFIYVQNESMLSMVGLYLGRNCRRIHRYILKSNINTPCQH